ncbi:MAG TPA: hypothetical protein VNQ55_07845 [Parapedobacter sp.]|nr:hypothetical protein [Parapedobacter sp.]
MNRFIDYFRRRVPLTDAAEQFLRQHGRIVAYDRHNHFLTPEVREPYWCVVLEGMACGYTLTKKQWPKRLRERTYRLLKVLGQAFKRLRKDSGYGNSISFATRRAYLKAVTANMRRAAKT